MKKINFKENFSLLNHYIQRHNLLMIIASIVVVLQATLYCLFWGFDPSQISSATEGISLIGSMAFLVIAVAMTIILVIARFVNFKSYSLIIIIHVYVFLLLLWNTIMCVIDLKFGLTPITYLMVFTLAAGLFVTEPLFFGTLTAASLIVILATSINNKVVFFSGVYQIDNTLTFISYFVAIILAAIEHYIVTINDYRIEKRLNQSITYDGITGFLTEKMYLKEIDMIDYRVNKNELDKYAVATFILNNFKTTNDTYGHRFGINLLERCGRILPKYFAKSKIFRIGGDEFVVIVYDEDLQKLDATLKEIKTKYAYSKIKQEGEELVLSIAQGSAVYEKGMEYKDVMQKANAEVFANKKKIVDKYKLER